TPGAVAVLETVLAALPRTPVVAVFDTAFHRTIPEPAALYPLPLDLSRRLALRRYGFHGISHRYVSARTIARLGRGDGPTRIVTCHLGNGCSVCAVRDGRSVDTSMGLTPLEGLMMGTRAGDVDPGLLLHLIREEKEVPQSIDQLLNHESGLLGVAGSNDMRDVQTRAAAGDRRAELAIDMFTYRIRKYVGAYAAALEGLDALAFSGGIGEHSALVRRRVCEPLAWLGVRFDADANEQPGHGEVCLTRPDSPVQVWRIPTDEERLIAEATVEVVGMPG
ncbi:MAG: acetate/propionate family kinase, partial [Gemmataceae bacterium]